MKASSLVRRRAADKVVKWISGIAAVGGCGVLGWILFVVIREGFGAIDWTLLTSLPAPPGVGGGGIANAIVGTIVLTALATLIGVPVGVLAGVFLAEFGKGTKLAETVRFAANILIGVPSIIIGVFVYTIMVVPMKNFSGYAGAVALAVIMIPIVARTTEDMLRMAPPSLREAALALGAPRWKVTLNVLFRAAGGGMLTGVLLAIARVTGETAPLLFTALNSPYWTRSLNQPTANLTVTIFNYAMSPYPQWQRAAWAASLLITLGVLSLTITSRFLIRGRVR